MYSKKAQTDTIDMGVFFFSSFFLSPFLNTENRFRGMILYTNQPESILYGYDVKCTIVFL